MREWDSCGLLELCTERAREVIVLAGEEARRSGQRNVGTEHLLLGMLGEQQGIAALALRSAGLTTAAVREELGVQFPWLTGERFDGDVLLTPRAEETLECALRESERLSHRYVGTEHLLLGLLSQDEGAALDVLVAVGVEPDAVTAAVRDLIPTGDRVVVVEGAHGVQTRGRLDGWFPRPPSRESRRLVMNAARSAHRSGRALIEDFDLVAALTHHTNVKALTEAGVDHEGLRRAVEHAAGTGTRPYAVGAISASRATRSPDAGAWTTVEPDAHVRQLLISAATSAGERGREEVEVSDVILALARDSDSGVVLASLGVNVEAVIVALDPPSGS